MEECPGAVFLIMSSPSHHHVICSSVGAVEESTTLGRREFTSEKLLASRPKSARDCSESSVCISKCLKNYLKRTGMLGALWRMRPAKCAPDRSESSMSHNRKKTRGSELFLEDEVQKMCTAVVRDRFDFHKEFASKNFNLVLVAGLISCLSSSETAPIGLLLPIVSSYFLHYFSPGAFRPGAFRPGMPGNMFYLYITFPVYRTIQSIQAIEPI